MTNSKFEITPTTRLFLSAKGHAASLAYETYTGRSGARGGNRRQLYETAREHWAWCHGTKPDDGPYLLEIAGGTTRRQLGEALAICSQSVEMVASAVTRLHSLGLVRLLGARSTPLGVAPTLAVASGELEAALADYAVARGEVAPTPHRDRYVATPRFRHAMFRVISAQAFFDKLSGGVLAPV